MYKKHIFLGFLIGTLLNLAMPSEAGVKRVIQGSGHIHYTVDGDTMDVKTTRANLQQLLSHGLVAEKHINWQRLTFRVRLAGVNTEESKHHDSSRNTTFGKQTSDHVRELLGNNPTDYLCFDRGRYGRAICSLTVTNVGDVGLYLITYDFSPYVSKYGNHPYYHNEYTEADAK